MKFKEIKTEANTWIKFKKQGIESERLNKGGDERIRDKCRSFQGYHPQWRWRCNRSSGIEVSPLLNADPLETTVNRFLQKGSSLPQSLSFSFLPPIYFWESAFPNANLRIGLLAFLFLVFK